MGVSGAGGACSGVFSKSDILSVVLPAVGGPLASG